MRRLSAITWIVAAASVGWLVSDQRPVLGQGRLLQIAPNTAATLRDSASTVEQMLRTGELQVRLTRVDTLVPGGTIEQLDQRYQGIRVWGGSVSRQLRGAETVSVFGTMYEGMSLGVTPKLSADDAKQAIERIGGRTLGPNKTPELVVLPMEDGTFRLVWVGEIATNDDKIRLFIDAEGGAIVRRYSTVHRQVPNAPIGRGTGVLGDSKKLTTDTAGGTFIAFDLLRPPVIATFNMRSNLSRALDFLNGVTPLVTSDYASDSDNDWSDTAVVDAHAHSGWTYDYYYKRFGRRGLDNADKRILSLTHLVRRSDVYTAPASIFFTFFINAFYAGDGVMVYGEGLPPGVFFTGDGKSHDYYSGALDIVAHELTHGVTDYTSQLEYINESGALNESFSDMMATGAEFFFHPAGSGPGKADYLLGEDVIRAVGAGARDGIRSLASPGLYDQPDHYSNRAILSLDQDNGGVHVNSGIPNNVFYLAIEGGTHRTSGIRVQGVGGGNRLQIERVFYRAFAQLMPSNANFSLARVVTLQAARDLYGVNSGPYNAIRDGWTAAGVN